MESNNKKFKQEKWTEFSSIFAWKILIILEWNRYLKN
jgi:hypothetical protein